MRERKRKRILVELQREREREREAPGTEILLRSLDWFGTEL
jgi:hypothetical protein